MEKLRSIVPIFYIVAGGSKTPKAEFSFEAINAINYFKIRSQPKPVLRKDDNSAATDIALDSCLVPLRQQNVFRSTQWLSGEKTESDKL